MSSTVITNLESARQALRRHFFGWQCRLRQLAVREAEGRPGAGMRPTAMLTDGAGEARPLARITTLIVKRESAADTDQLRHLYKKTHDPAARREAALKFFAAAYYQRPDEFADALTALFGPDSALAAGLIAAGHCRLDFEQYSQRYRLPCRVDRLDPATPLYQATYWHNSLFNPRLPGGVQVIKFTPDWTHAVAEPGVSSPAEA